MRKLIISSLVCLFQCGFLSAAEVEIASPKPAHTAVPLAGTQSPTPGMPMYRPSLLGTGPASLINRIDTKKLMEQGQKDGSLMFCCSVKTTGEVINTWIYGKSPDTDRLQEEVFRCLDNSVF